MLQPAFPLLHDLLTKYRMPFLSLSASVKQLEIVSIALEKSNVYYRDQHHIDVIFLALRMYIRKCAKITKEHNFCVYRKSNSDLHVTMPETGE